MHSLTMSTARYTQIMRTFGRQLRKARKAAGYNSAQQFAGVLGKEPHTYRHYERGEAEPDFTTLLRICELLKITTDYLLPVTFAEGNPEKSSSSSSRSTAA
jgi:transcriptional regulator with XRE-family HTH domain